MPRRRRSKNKKRACQTGPRRIAGDTHARTATAAVDHQEALRRAAFAAIGRQRRAAATADAEGEDQHLPEAEGAAAADAVDDQGTQEELITEILAQAGAQHEEDSRQIAELRAALAASQAQLSELRTAHAYTQRLLTAEREEHRETNRNLTAAKNELESSQTRLSEVFTKLRESREQITRERTAHEEADHALATLLQGMEVGTQLARQAQRMHGGSGPRFFEHPQDLGGGCGGGGRGPTVSADSTPTPRADQAADGAATAQDTSRGDEEPRRRTFADDIRSWATWGEAPR